MYKIITKKNNLPKLAKMMRKLEKAKSEYGYFQETGTHYSGLSYAYLMSIHEWGTRNGHIPARKPFSKALFEHSENMLRATMKSLSKHINSASTGVYIPPTAALNTFGALGVYHTKAMFGTGLKPDNKPSTIARKRSGNNINNPLIDYGDLRDAMSFKISNGGGV